MTLAIDLADDRVVADVFLDRVFEGLGRHVRSACSDRVAARSFALRARGFRSISASVGTCGRLVRMLIPPAACRARSVCFTTRSSSEWNVITTRRPAGAEPAGRVREEPVEPVELAIHPDADRLERPRRRIDSRVALPRDRLPDDLRQTARRLDAPSATGLDDRPRHPSCVALFAEFVNHVRQRSFIGGGQHVGRRRAARSVHPHVERLVSPEAESAIRRVELHRRHAEIGQHTVHRDRCRARRAPRRGCGSRRGRATPDRQTPSVPHRRAPARPDRDRSRSAASRRRRAARVRVRRDPPCNRRTRRPATARDARAPRPPSPVRAPLTSMPNAQGPMLKAQRSFSSLSSGHCAFSIGHCSEVIWHCSDARTNSSRRRQSTARAGASGRSAPRSTLRDTRCARRPERRLQSRRCLGGAAE